MSPGLHSERVYGIMMRQEQQYKAGGIPIPFLALPLPLLFFLCDSCICGCARVCGRSLHRRRRRRWPAASPSVSLLRWLGHCGREREGGRGKDTYVWTMDGRGRTRGGWVVARSLSA